MTTTKNDVFTFLLVWIDFWWDGIKFGEEEINEQILVGGRTPASPQWRKTCINFANRFLHTVKKLLAHHIHHVPKWISYFCQIWALCVRDIYGIYFHLSAQCLEYNKFITSWTSLCLIRPNDGKSISQKSISH